MEVCRCTFRVLVTLLLMNPSEKYRNSLSSAREWLNIWEIMLIRLLAKSYSRVLILLSRIIAAGS